MLFDPKWNETIPEVEIKPNKIGKILIDSLALIQKKGWCQYAFHSADDSYCMVGAICEKATNYTDTMRALDLLKQVTGADDIPVWNDQLGRTHKEVYDAFRKAIELAGRTGR